MAEINDIEFYKGEAIALVFTMTPLTDITGWTIEMNVKYDATDTAVLLTIAATITTAAAGIFTVNLTSAQTKTLYTSAGGRPLAYDVQRTDAAAEAVLSIGSLSILQEVKY